MRNPTLKDIADLTNLSTSTVSRILNEDPSFNVLEETKALVIKTANDLGYIKVNKNKELNKLKIVLIHWYTREQELEDNYYLSIRLGIENYAREHNLEVLKVFVGDTILPDASGAIALGKFDEKEVEIFSSRYENIVFVDSSPDPEKFDSVIIDFEKAYKDAIDYLKELGYQKIGYIGGREYTKTLNKSLGDRRELVFKNEFKDSPYIHIGTFDIESGYQLMKEAINKGLAESYLIASDEMAIGALKALHESNLKVPRDVGIIGFNDILQSSYTIPPLTTIKVYKDYMGEKAVKLLLEQISGRNIYEKVLIQTKLIIRESTRMKE